MTIKHIMHTALLLSALCFFHASIAFAQVDIPGSADVGRAETSVPSPDFNASIVPDINIPEVSVEGAPEGADEILLLLGGIKLEGVSVYDLSDLRQLYKDKVGEVISLTEIYGIAQSITRKYRNDGYLITQAVVPEQTIDNGIVTIRIVEGFIDKVSVEGDENTLAYQRILSLANNLTKISPLTAKELERWLLLINDLPGVSARSIISASETTIGGADLLIIPEIDPFDVSLSVDNYGSRYLGPLQLSGAIQFNNLFNAAELLEAQFVTDSDDDELLYGYTRLSLPINRHATQLGFDFTHSATRPGFDLELFEVEGASTTYGLDISHPFIRTRTENLFAKLRFDYRDLKSSNVVDLDKTEDQIAALRASLGYSKFDTFLWRPAVNQVSLQLSQGLDVLNASAKGDENMTRANGDPTFTKLDASISRLQSLSNDLALLVGAEGQWSNNPLLSSEEFGIGGRLFGRGYDSSELVGDDGFATKMELQWTPTIEDPLFHGLQFFGFWDFGKTWNQQEFVSSIKTRSISSAGLGVRFDFTENLSGEFVYAQPLTKAVDVRSSDDARFFFSLTATF